MSFDRIEKVHAQNEHVLQSTGQTESSMLSMSTYSRIYEIDCSTHSVHSLSIDVVVVRHSGRITDRSPPQKYSYATQTYRSMCISDRTANRLLMLCVHRRRRCRRLVEHINALPTQHVFVCWHRVWGIALWWSSSSSSSLVGNSVNGRSCLLSNYDFEWLHKHSQLVEYGLNRWLVSICSIFRKTAQCPTQHVMKRFNRERLSSWWIAKLTSYAQILCT